MSFQLNVCTNAFCSQTFFIFLSFSVRTEGFELTFNSKDLQA